MSWNFGSTPYDGALWALRRSEDEAKANAQIEAGMVTLAREQLSKFSAATLEAIATVNRIAAERASMAAPAAPVSRSAAVQTTGAPRKLMHHGRELHVNTVLIPAT